jgi:hypothetical protein
VKPTLRDNLYASLGYHAVTMFDRANPTYACTVLRAIRRISKRFKNDCWEGCVGMMKQASDLSYISNFGSGSSFVALAQSSWQTRVASGPGNVTFAYGWKWRESCLPRQGLRSSPVQMQTLTSTGELGEVGH